LGVQLVIIEARVRYLSPARYGDEIEVRGAFTDVRPASLTITYTLTEAESGRLVATPKHALHSWTPKPAAQPALQTIFGERVRRRHHSKGFILHGKVRADKQVAPERRGGTLRGLDHRAGLWKMSARAAY
jgi:hypothetical protein